MRADVAELLTMLRVKLEFVLYLLEQDRIADAKAVLNDVLGD
jgi:hypothetical protein